LEQFVASDTQPLKASQLSGDPRDLHQRGAGAAMSGGLIGRRSATDRGGGRPSDFAAVTAGKARIKGEDGVRPEPPIRSPLAMAAGGRCGYAAVLAVGIVVCAGAGRRIRSSVATWGAMAPGGRLAISEPLPETGTRIATGYDGTLARSKK
jgi:hypothetical protein